MAHRFAEGCAYRLDQDTFQIKHAQQLFESGSFTGFEGVAGLLGPGVDGHLGDEPVVAFVGLDHRTTQRLAIAYLLV